MIYNSFELLYASIIILKIDNYIVSHSIFCSAFYNSDFDYTSGIYISKDPSIKFFSWLIV